MTLACKPATGTPFHLVVWIDHRCARLIALAHDTSERLIRNCADVQGHTHHKAGTPGPGHADIDEGFLKSVAEAIGEAREILIVGPADVKNVLHKFLERHAPTVAARVLSVQAMDHASEGEIRGFAAQYFKQADPLVTPRR